MRIISNISNSDRVFTIRGGHTKHNRRLLFFMYHTRASVP